jgi:hypothetical protein
MKKEDRPTIGAHTCLAEECLSEDSPNIHRPRSIHAERPVIETGHVPSARSPFFHCMELVAFVEGVGPQGYPNIIITIKPTTAPTPHNKKI